jgi:hypothetical protein
LLDVSRLLMAVSLILVCCAPAQAARKVATSGEFELRARQQDGRLCITLKRAGRYQGQKCGRVPRSPHRPLRMFPDVGFNNYAAAVAPSVRTAETESRRGRRERHRTFAARGFSARFVLLPAPPSAVFVRFYGADGTLLGVDAGPAGYIGFDDETPVFGEPGQGVDVHTEPRLAPMPGDAGRLRTLACVDGTNGNSGGVICDEEAENALVLLAACEGRDLVGAIVAAGVAGLRLTLGSGAEVHLPASELPAVFGARRVVAGQAPSGEAVREAAALDAAGEVIARAALGTPPGGQPCAGEDQAVAGFGGILVPASPPPGAALVASAGGEALLAADQGETLCVGIGVLTARVCPPPPVDSDRPSLLRRGGTVAGVLSQDAAQVTLGLDRGDDVTVATTAGAAYAGRWAGRVRFFAAPVGAGQEVTGAVVRDASGRIIGISERGVPRPSVRHTVLAQRAGRGVQVVRREGEPPCLTAFAEDLPPAPRFCTDLDPGTQIDGPYLPYSGAVTVPCAPRRALAYGRMPDRFAAPHVVLDRGRSVRSRKLSLRGQDAWVAFLPDVAARGLRSGKHSAPLDLPPASSQCGYTAERHF